MKKKDSQIIKGIAVVLMLFYQLFANEEVYEKFALTGLISEGIIKRAAVACEVCVSLFVFVTAYGISVQNKDKLFDKRKYAGSFFRRYKKLMGNFLYVFSFVLLFTYVFQLEYTTQVAFERTSKIGRVISIFGNITGAADLLQASWFSPSWWYISLAILLFACIPLLQLLVKKAGSVLTLVLSAFAVIIFELSTGGSGMLQYLLIAVTGIIFAEYDLLEKPENYIKSKKGMRVFCTILIIFAALFTVIIRPYFESTFIPDIILTLLIVFLVKIFISRIPVVRDVLSAIGRESMFIWLITAFFTTHWLSEYTYSFKNIWVIYLFLIIATFVTAIVLSLIKEGYKRFVMPKIYEKKWKMIVISLVMIAFWFIIAFVSAIPTYMTCDDGDIQNLLNGSVLGTPYITHQFINIILGVFISTLYKLASSIEWWYVYNLFIIALGMFLIHISILKVCKDKKLNPGFGIFLMAFIDLSFIVYCISNVSYTTTPAILGTGIIAFLFATANMNGKRRGRLIYFVALFGYIFVLIERRNSALIILCFILLAFLWRYASLYGEKKQYKTLIKKFSLTAAVFILITLGLNCVNQYVKKEINGEEFTEFNSARIEYMDYGHGSYEENKEAFEEAGWSRELYSLVGASFFIDENVTAENLSYLAETTGSDESYLELIKSTLKDGNCQAVILVWLVSVFFAVLVLAMRFNKKHMWFIIMNNIGSLILLFYQITLGRILYRTILIVLLPAFVINCFITINDYRSDKKDGSLIKLLLFFSAVFCGLYVLNYVFDTGRYNYKKYLTNNCTSIEKIVTENKDNIYIYASGLYNNISPVSVLASGNDLTNMIPWGGTSYKTAAYEERLELNGLDGISGETFKLDNVYLLSDSNLLAEDYVYRDSNQMIQLYKYLEENFNVKGFVITDVSNDRIYAYHYVFDENTDDYDEYYTVLNDEIVKVVNESE